MLIPWKRPDDLRRAMAVSRGFIVDNSAFTFWKSGESPVWSEYITWLRPISRNPRFDWAIIPDAIDGSETDNNELIRLWDKQAYYPVRIDGAPVWHMHESFDRLERLVRHFPRICIGSSGKYSTPGVGAWWDRMDEAFGLICDDKGIPKVKVHGLRMLRRDIVERYPFASCDSTNAVQNGSRKARQLGTDTLWGALTIARQIEMAQSPSRFTHATDQPELFARAAEVSDE